MPEQINVTFTQFQKKFPWKERRIKRKEEIINERYKKNTNWQNKKAKTITQHRNIFQKKKKNGGKKKSQ